VGRVGCIVVAAGSGTRLGADRPKAFVPLAGSTLLEHAISRLLASRCLSSLAVVVPAAHVDHARLLLHQAPEAGPAAAAGVRQCGLVVVAGGPDRTTSVRLGLVALPTEVTTVLVHDAARCLVPPDLVRRVVAALGSRGAVVPGLPLADTVKQVDDAGNVVHTPDRSALRVVQTPQGFARELLERAHDAVDPLQPGATDDAGLVERLGRPVAVVPGSPWALKITTQEDLRYAEWLLTRPGQAVG
jgi:2-C-methyl-D-erythritol 4-phosphate cytidylyltransferase